MTVKIVSFNSIHSSQIIRIRTCVFVKEQNIDTDIDFDGQDETAIHVLVYQNKKAVGTARMLGDGHIGRMAVLKKFRHAGAGSQALNALINEAKKIGLMSVFLNAQLSAIGFYEKFGFKSSGDIFIDAGIEHIEMKATL